MSKKDFADTNMPLLEHIRELRRRLLISLVFFAVCSFAAFFAFEGIVEVFLKQYAGIPSAGGANLYMTTIFEGFSVRVKLSFLAGLIFSLPVHFYNAVRFIFPGLLPREKRIFVVSLFASFILIAVSAYFSYFKLIPFSISFLTNKSFIPGDVGLLLNYGRNIFYVFSFILWSVVAFQSPIVLMVLMALGLVKRKTVFRLSRYVIVGIFVVAAAITPPDFISQLAVALPLVLLYFLAILLARILRLGE